MQRPTITPHDLATGAGALILAAATNAVIVKTGGYLTSHALLVSGLALGVGAASWCLGKGIVPRHIAAIVIASLVAGELYNFASTAERIVTVREEAQAPLRHAAEKRDGALDRLAKAEAQAPSSERLMLAKARLAETMAEAKGGPGDSQRVRIAREEAKAAQITADAEAANIRCHTECLRKQAIADKARAALTQALNADAEAASTAVTAAEAEVAAALAEAVAQKAAAIEAAKAGVAATPAPPSATPLADRTGIPAWALDLALAALLSLAANGLAACLIAVGARGGPDTRPDARLDAESDAFGQSDYAPAAVGDATVVRLFAAGLSDRPAGRSDGRGNGPDRPKLGSGGRRDGGVSPGPGKSPVRPTGGLSGGLTKSEAFDDLTRRLSDGRTVDSQDELAAAWHRPKQTVSDWMREWRRIGVIPAATPAGRCKATVPA